MTSSGVYVIDIESRFPAVELEQEYSSNDDDEIKPRSLPLSQINWEAYCKSGNKASFAWLFFLFSVLAGLVVQQASLFSLTTSTMRTTTLLSSSLEGGSSFSPPLVLTSPASAAREKTMTEVVDTSPANDKNRNISTNSDENVNKKISNEETSINDESQQQKTTSSLDNNGIPMSSSTASSADSNTAQKK